MGSVRRVVVSAVLVAIVAALGFGSSASATTATITSPSDGSVLANGFAGPVDVAFGSDLAPGTFTISVTGAGYSWQSTPTITDPGSYPFSIPPIVDAGAYTATVTEGATVIASNSFTVEAVDSASITSPLDASAFLDTAEPEAVSVAWSSISDTDDSYSVSVAGVDGVVASCPFAGAGLLGTTTQCALPVLAAGGYSVSVSNDTDATTIATSAFTIVPRVAVTGTSLAPSPFFPFERDGFRDQTVFAYTLNRQAMVTFTIKNRLGRVIRWATLRGVAAGTHHILWGGKNQSGQYVTPGVFTVHIAALANGLKATGLPRAVSVAIGLHITSASVAPIDFYPLKVDGYRDRTTFAFATNKYAIDTVQVRNSSGAIVRHINLGLRAPGKHSVTWAGGNDNGRKVNAGTFYIRLVAQNGPQTKASHWLTIRVHSGPTTGGGGGGGGSCTPGYSPCLIYHGGADYDCFGGGGNGPYYTAPGVTYRVTGSDPYGLDANHNGLGCE